VDAAGVPMIHNTTEPKVAGDGEAGSPWIFGNRPPNDGAARIAARYAVEELGAEEIGQLYVNTAFGQSGNEAQDAEIEELGAEVAAERSFEFNATDLTEAVLAMEDVDVVLDWGTPATVGLAVNTLAQQGLADVPHIGPGSVGFSFFADIVGDESLLEGVLGVVDCNPADDDREGVGPGTTPSSRSTATSRATARRRCTTRSTSSPRSSTRRRPPTPRPSGRAWSRSTATRGSAPPTATRTTCCSTPAS